MDIIEKIAHMIAPSLEAMGYEIVQLKLADAQRRKTLSLMAERADGRIMSFDDCTEISRTVSALLDVEDPINGAYHLEVCSPGVDRPLVRMVDYVRHLQHEIKLETLIPVEGRKRFRGLLVSAENGQIGLETEQGAVLLPFASVKSAKLVMTDALMKSFLKKAEAQA